MKYQSTRGQVSGLSFVEAVMMGLASDGGLLVPQSIPDLRSRLKSLRGMSYNALAFEIMRHYIDDLSDKELVGLIDTSYATFDHEMITPLKSLDDFHVLELFHGPTLAFKDVALQFLGNLFEHILEGRDARLNILCATSGDTGSAAIAGVRGKARINIFVLYPTGKTSPLQERQMTTVLDDNVHNISLNGSFDDCQTLMKSVFSDLNFRDQYQLGAVNSVNWARILAQIVYYFSAWCQLDCPDRFNVAVPTGNFGNIFAGYLAKRMGLPIHRLILATNQNDILANFFNSGLYQRGDVHFTHSPAMDIQIASNFERYLFFEFEQATDKVTDFMNLFQSTGSANVNFNTKRHSEDFLAGAASNEETLQTIKWCYEKQDYLVDPHTAVGIHVGRQFSEPGIPFVCLSTAHPAKFEGAMKTALPEVTVTHPILSELTDLPERKQQMEVDEQAVKDYLATRAD
jgi:threonine synthase